MKKAHRDHFVQFQDHTLLKHAILRRYLSTWAEKLLGWPQKRYERIWLVDAFAGAGADQQGNPGSPLIAAQIAQGIHNKRGLDRPPFRIFAVEKDGANYEDLVAIMEPFSNGPQRVIDVRQGTPADYIELLMEFVGDDPVLFFLDPFGVDGLRADLLSLMLQGPHNEVFALFSDTGASRLLAVLTKEARDSDEEVKEVLRSPTLFAELDEERVEQVLAEVDKSNQTLLGTKPHAERIISDALGQEALQELLRTSTEQRQAQAARIWREALHAAGAQYSVALPIRNTEGGRLHQLVYASKSQKGLITMKECMSSSLRDPALPVDLKSSIAFDVRLEVGEVIEQVTAAFAGQELAWTGKEGLKEWILANTDVLQLQMGELKSYMDREGWIVSKRPIRVSVPAE